MFSNSLAADSLYVGKSNPLTRESECIYMSEKVKQSLQFFFIKDILNQVSLFCWGFTWFSTLFQLYYSNISFIHEPWVNKPVLR